MPLIKKPFVFIALFTLAISSGYGQDNQLLDTFSRAEIPVLIEPMQFPADVPPLLVERIQNVAYLSVEQHWHYRVVNNSTEENTGEVDPEYLFQLSLEPLVDDLSQRDIYDTLGVLTQTKYSVTAGLSFNLRVTNIVNGELKYSREVRAVKGATGYKNFLARNMVFSYSETQKKMYPFPASPQMEAEIIQETKNKLLLDALDAFPAIWQQALNELFPAPMHLVKVIKGKRKKPKMIVVDAGEDYGISKGAILDLFTYDVYQAMGQTFVREEKLAAYYPTETEAHRSSGYVYFGRKEVGRALERGKQVFVRFRKL